MSKTKRIFAILMTMALAMSMLIASSVASFAAPDTEHTINITSAATQKEDHTYEAYQVFVGTYDATSGQLKNFAWGSGVNSTALLTELKKSTAYAECETAAQVAAVLNGKADDSAEAKAFAEAVSKCLSSEKATSTGNKTDGYEIDVVGDGYYFIKDTTTSLDEGDTYSSFMLQVIGDVDVAAKDSTTESSKKVKDVVDTTGTQTEWQDSADYDIGDKVPFKLTGKVADDYDKYTEYTFIFHDKESNGLTFNNDAKVYVDGDEITTGFEVVTSGLKDDCTFEVRFADLKAVKDVKAGSVITVEYTSTLNDNAVVGQKGNPNTSHIEFSNNPNGDQSGTGKTPDDTVIVFTYKTTVTKLDENRAALSGAGFTLYKEVTSTYKDPKTGETAKTGSAIKNAFSDSVAAKAGALVDANYYVPVAGSVSGDKANIFTFKGIDDGKYVLVETTIPAGYNAWTAVEFEVTATHTATADIDPATGKKAGANEYILTGLTGAPLFSGDQATGSVTLESEKADLDVSIVNESGAELPETGGIGTIIFYVLGTLLVVGCGIVLISKKRMESK